MGDLIWKMDNGIPRRLQETTPGAFANEVYTQDPWSAAIGLGNAYLLSTGRLDTGQAGVVRALIENPVGAATFATILGVSVYSTGEGWVDVMRNPTQGLPPADTNGFSFDINPYVGEGPHAILRHATGATTEVMGGGTERETVTGLPAGQRTVIGPLGIPIAPGESFGMEADFAARSKVVITFYMVEEEPPQQQ